eukprot:CFRG4995T1
MALDAMKKGIVHDISDTKATSICVVCGKDSDRACPCDERLFCSRECQKVDWNKGGHKLSCSKSQPPEPTKKSSELKESMEDSPEKAIFTNTNTTDKTNEKCEDITDIQEDMQVEDKKDNYLSNADTDNDKKQNSSNANTGDETIDNESLDTRKNSEDVKKLAVVDSADKTNSDYDDGETIVKESERDGDATSNRDTDKKQAEDKTETGAYDSLPSSPPSATMSFDHSKNDRKGDSENSVVSEDDYQKQSLNMVEEEAAAMGNEVGSASGSSDTTRESANDKSALVAAGSRDDCVEAGGGPALEPVEDNNTPKESKPTKAKAEFTKGGDRIFNVKVSSTSQKMPKIAAKSPSTAGGKKARSTDVVEMRTQSSADKMTLDGKRRRRRFEELDRNYVCEYPNCGRPYASEHSLNQHVRLKHAVRSPDRRRRGFLSTKGIPPVAIKGHPSTGMAIPPHGHQLARHPSQQPNQHTPVSRGEAVGGRSLMTQRSESRPYSGPGGPSGRLSSENFRDTDGPVGSPMTGEGSSAANQNGKRPRKGKSIGNHQSPAKRRAHDQDSSKDSIIWSHPPGSTPPVAAAPRPDGEAVGDRKHSESGPESSVPPYDEERTQYDHHQGMAAGDPHGQHGQPPYHMRGYAPMPIGPEGREWPSEYGVRYGDGREVRGYPQPEKGYANGWDNQGAGAGMPPNERDYRGYPPPPADSYGRTYGYAPGYYHDPRDPYTHPPPFGAPRPHSPYPAGDGRSAYSYAEPPPRQGYSSGNYPPQYMPPPPSGAVADPYWSDARYPPPPEGRYR